MLSTFLKQIAQSLPPAGQRMLKHAYFARQIRKGAFTADEPEFERLAEWIGPGDWAIDCGANGGTYTIEMSRLVGPSGRVIALEPMFETFELLASNIAAARCDNVTVLNVAATSENAVLQMTVPTLRSGLSNLYMAQITNSEEGFSVLGIPVDSVLPQHRVSLVKVDVEGHELSALLGMRELIVRDGPVLVVEGNSPEVEKLLDSFGYAYTRAKGSPNRVYRTVQARASV